MNDKAKLTQDKSNLETAKQLRSLIIFVSVVSILVGLGVYAHLNTDQSNPKAEAFFKARKSPEEHFEYQEEEMSAKKKAERNIFLQK